MNLSDADNTERDEMLAKQEDDRRRDNLGRIVREVWIAWAKNQPTPKPSWLVPYELLPEQDKEVDRRIGERLYREGAKETASQNALVWATRKALRRAFIEAISPLYHQLGVERPFGFGKHSRDHLLWMCKELLEKIDVFPVDKTSRWIGFIQGVMAANIRLDVDKERERTRPLFQRAYEIEKATVL